MRIVLSDYSPDWPRMFDEMRAALTPLVPPQTAIEHIGSTSVPGLAAKPVIDILIGLADFERANEWVPPIQSLGFEYVPQFETMMPYRRFFRKESAGVRTHHIHMVG